MKKKRNINDKTEKLVNRIAFNIQRIRKSRGLTQEDMAELGFGPRWYQRFESGSHIPTIPTLEKLSRAFEVDITEFFK